MAGILDHDRLRLLDRIVRCIDERELVGEDVRRAVNTLVASAAPDRADRMLIAPGAPCVLAERLAAWALARASSDAVGEASAILDDARVRDLEIQFVATAPTTLAIEECVPGCC